MGQAYLAIGRISEAKACFIKSLIEDVCPLRMLPQMRQFIIDFCAKEKIPHIDLQALLEEHIEAPVIGSEILVDHVHPSIRGHQIIAESITETIFKYYLGHPEDETWISKRKEVYKAQLDSLDDLYYTHGQLRLENLLLWTQGESDGLPIEMHKPIEPK